MTPLGVIWYFLAALLLSLFAMLDGFDLGAGILYGASPEAARRERILGSISPIWNGNEVWLIAGMGSLLAAFPPVYSSLLSSLYLPVMLVLVGIVLRACGVELRSKVSSPVLVRFLEGCVFLGSLIPAWATGLVAGNVLLGFPLDKDGNLAGSFLFFLRPYALLWSCASTAAFVLHGALFVALKSEDEDRAALLVSARKALLALLVIGVLGVVSAPLFLSDRLARASSLPVSGLLFLLLLGAYVGVALLIRRKSPGAAFAASFVGIAAAAATAASLLFPTLLPSTLGAANDLTIANAASADKSLAAMLVIAAVGVPLIAVYVIVAYRVFRGKAATIHY